jgi:hypothetical protein
LGYARAQHEVEKGMVELEGEGLVEEEGQPENV